MSSNPFSGNATTNTAGTLVLGNESNAPPVQATYDNTSEGGATKRAGQKFGELFKDAVKLSYTNLTASPVLMTMYIIIIIVSTAEILAVSNGPLEQWLAYLKTVKPTYVLGLWLQKFELWLLTILIANKELVLVGANFLMPVFYKPSNKNIYFAAGMTLFSVFIIQKQPIEILIMGQLWLLYTQLRDNKFKFIIVAIAVTIFILPSTGLLEYMSGTTDPTKNATVTT